MRTSASTASGSPATTAALASRTGWRSTIRDAVDEARGARHRRRRSRFYGHRPGARDRVLPLVLPDPAVALPERLIGADPVVLPAPRSWARWGRRLACFDPRALAEYVRCFADPRRSTRPARTTAPRATIDLEHDAADTAPIACPLLVLWGERGVVNRLFHPLDDWRAVATDVRGQALPSGHYLAEEVPGRRWPNSRHFSPDRIRTRSGPYGDVAAFAIIARFVAK